MRQIRFGVVEAGCKKVIGHQVKQSGMHWSGGCQLNHLASLLANEWPLGGILGGKRHCLKTQQQF
jgi:hypothetical protein